MIDQMVEMVLQQRPDYRENISHVHDLVAQSYNRPSAPMSGQDEGAQLTFFKCEEKKKLVTCNVMFSTTKVGNVFIPLLVANEDIAPNSQLGFSYGRDYWIGRGMQPRYFYSDGSLIPASAYKNTFYECASPSLRLLSGIISDDPQILYKKAQALYNEAIKLYKNEISRSDRTIT